MRRYSSYPFDKVEITGPFWSERLETVLHASQEMIRPTVYGQAVIFLVFAPLLTFTGVEGKMFQPMALTVIFALVAASILSLTFVPAMVALCLRGQVREQDSLPVQMAKYAYAPVLRLACDPRLHVTGMFFRRFELHASSETAHDLVVARRLWEACEAMLALAEIPDA